MEKFISAKEYEKIKSKQDKIVNEIMESLSEEEQFKIGMLVMTGDKESLLEAFDKVFDKVLENETMIEIREQLQDSIIEQEITKEQFEKTIKSFEELKKESQNPENAEALDFVTTMMSKLQSKLGFGDSYVTDSLKNIALANELLRETNSSFETMQTYTKNDKMISLILNSTELDGTKHEFTLSLEEDKIYHKTISPENEIIQSEEYISDKKQEFGIENEEGMSL